MEFQFGVPQPQSDSSAPDNATELLRQLLEV